MNDIKTKIGFNYLFEFNHIKPILQTLISITEEQFSVDSFRMFNNNEEERFGYHLLKMQEAGFIEFDSNKNGGNILIHYPIVTFLGHKYVMEH